MFGSSNNQDQPQDNTQPDPDANDDHGFTMDAPAADPAAPLPEPTASPTNDVTSAPHVDESHTDLGVPPLGDSPASLPPAQPPTTSNNDSDDAATPDADSDLLAIKQQALTELSPIIDHLDQSPEDKFKTLMMMIQANDNQDLIKEAYAAAQQIPDEKAKSQALLDVVNEINYFTQKKINN